MDLTYIMFTKHLEGLDVPGIVDALQSVGVQGADLCVRDGYPVNPDNIATALPEAAKRFADAGRSIPLVTAPGDFNRPDIDYAEGLFQARGTNRSISLADLARRFPKALDVRGHAKVPAPTPVFVPRRVSMFGFW